MCPWFRQVGEVTKDICFDLIKYPGKEAFKASTIDHRQGADIPHAWTLAAILEIRDFGFVDAHEMGAVDLSEARIAPGSPQVEGEFLDHKKELK